ncbi:hypothetical protein N7509_003518 [Penicillium cosmopolitanum]|uniref:Selenoprotein W-like protein n=1 Tax=Penicillium cosmopolitanum TaxID=1131564 RepID=A0A9X0BBJ7_9EURO|nr:uncharacterized protein N7509_003518 [Penicillium cosmopolitanum]KAJ5403647.1 hypothetical protein N7509_003518 [Penicillium cosmopolitanum]
MTESTPPIEARLTPGSAPQSETPGPGSEANTTALERVQLPRISIKFCTQCKWMLRAAYFAQELLSTFGTDLGEVALVPMTGGVFTVTIWSAGQQTALGEASTEESILWDRKRDGGFPEVKALKSLVRNVIAPNRDLGHTDRALKKQAEEKKAGQQETNQDDERLTEKKECEDCI